jgi:photosystem II stability/assembly factor-like uncharacterized protein
MSISRLGRLAPALAFLLALQAASPAQAQGTWRWLQPRPTGADLRDVSFSDTLRGYACGSRSTILRTTDGGATWSRAATPARGDDLVAISAAGSLVVAVGAQGQVLRSTDAGSTFAAAPAAGLATAFVDVQVLDPTSGFLLAADGAVYATSDGFSSFSARGRPSSGLGRALYFDSPRRGWVVGGSASGSASFIARTDDAGATFTQVYAGAGGPLNAVTGVSQFGRVVVVAVGEGLPRGASSFDEAGLVFQPFDTLGGALTSVSLTASASGSAELWFAGQDGILGARVGDNAFQTPFTQPRPRLWSVASPAFGRMVGVGEGGTIVQASYGSRPGVTVAGNRRERFTRATFPTSDGFFGALVDDQAGAPRPVFTSNGAATLTLGQVAPGRIADLQFVDASVGYGLVETGQLFVTSNGGTSWAQRQQFAQPPRTLAFTSATTGYAGGPAGMLLTRDSGVTWTPVQLPVTARGTIVDLAASASGAVAVTDQGDVLVRSGPALDAAWVVATSTGERLATIALTPSSRWLAGGALTSGVGRVWFAAAGAPVATIATSSGVLSIATVGERAFVLSADGAISELGAGATAFSDTFETGAKLLGIAARQEVDASGRVVVAPFAFGDFGALLEFEDASQPANQPPTVSVDPSSIALGPGQTTTVRLIARDPEGQSLSFSWVDIAGVGLKFASPLSETTEVAWAVLMPPSGTHVIRGTTCDPQGACSSADLLVTVPGAMNQPPVVAVRETDLVARAGELVRLLASATDPDGDPVTLRWSSDDASLGLALAEGGPGEAEFVAPPALAGRTVLFTATGCDTRGACAFTRVRVRIEAATGVVADAGPDQLPGAPSLPVSIRLDGSASTGVIATYAWSQLSGPAAELTGADAATCIAVLPSAGRYVFRLSIRGVDGSSSTDDVAIVISTPAGPIARAGDDRTVGFGARVQLDARASSDPLGRRLTFRWTVPEELPVAGTDGPLALFFAPPREATYDFEVLVCAAPDACAADVVRVVVKAGANLPPLADAGPDRTGAAGTLVALDGSFSFDPEGRRLLATWTQRGGPAGQIADASAAWTRVQLPAVEVETTLTFELRVCDPERTCATDSVEVRVLPRDARSPVVTLAVAGRDDATVDEVAPFELVLTVTCPAAACRDDARVVLVRGPPIAREPASGFRFVPPRVSRDLPALFEAVACDAEDRCGFAALELLVLDTLNEPPVPVVASAQSARSRQRVVLDASRSYDPNGDPLSFRWVQTAGPLDVALRSTDNARAEFTVPVDAAGEYAWEVTVCDGRGACEAAVSRVTFEVGAPFNRPPLADAGGDRAGPSGLPVVLDGTRSFDADGDPLSFEWETLESPLAELTGASSARPTLFISEAVAAPIRVRLTVCDPSGDCARDEISIAGYPVPRDIALGTVTVGESTRGCGCAGDGAAGASLLGACALRRRRRRS